MIGGFEAAGEDRWARILRPSAAAGCGDLRGRTDEITGEVVAGRKLMAEERERTFCTYAHGGWRASFTSRKKSWIGEGA